LSRLRERRCAARSWSGPARSCQGSESAGAAPGADNEFSRMNSCVARDVVGARQVAVIMPAGGGEVGAVSVDVLPTSRTSTNLPAWQPAIGTDATSCPNSPRNLVVCTALNGAAATFLGVLRARSSFRGRIRWIPAFHHHRGFLETNPDFQHQTLAHKTHGTRATTAIACPPARRSRDNVFSPKHLATKSEQDSQPRSFFLRRYRNPNTDDPKPGYTAHRGSRWAARGTITTRPGQISATRGRIQRPS
jgi:hypothetical protein